MYCFLIPGFLKIRLHEIELAIPRMSGRVPYAEFFLKEAAVFLQQFPGFSGPLPNEELPRW
jgi:hypothetical protein